MIDLSYNFIKDLKDLKKFSKLLSLNMASNKIIMKTILDMPISLKKLNISDNQINCLSIKNNGSFISYFQSLVNLEELDLSFNNLEKIHKPVNWDKPEYEDAPLEARRRFENYVYGMALNVMAASCS